MQQSEKVEVIIEALKRYKGVHSDSALAKILDISSSTISGWRRKGIVSRRIICSAMPEINPDWLMTASGEMFGQEVVQAEKKSLPESDVVWYREQMSSKDEVIKNLMTQNALLLQLLSRKE